MIELTEIKRVVHVTSAEDVNGNLAGGLVLLQIAPGVDENGAPIMLYSLGCK